ncbi:MAG TPA: acetate--CoA ligase [Planctomycetota bacterium]|nr:acetate--CoA ligase [Planctomycetota bacterium]
MTVRPGDASHDQGVAFPPSAEASRGAHVASIDQYRELYDAAARDPEEFWADEARSALRWRKPFLKVLDWNFREPKIRWFEDGTLNVSENCLDRHVSAGRGGRTAIVWEGDDPKESRRLTYAELLKLVCRFAHVLARHGVKKGDRVCLYLPMVPEAAAAMLACARIGAVHSVVFGGFSAESLGDRIVDCGAKVLITADQGLRGGRTVELKRIADAAAKKAPCLERMLVLRRTGADVPFDPARDRWLHDELAAAGVLDAFPPVEVGAEDPLFILYTSGSTGKPKGVLHTSAGYLLYAAYTHRMVFDWRPDDVFWCTADVGWVTGHSYVVYGPLCNGATTVMFEGVPTYPDAGRFWDVVDRHKVTVFYTAPTAIRALEAQGDRHVTSRSRASLRLLGSVGEPINPEAWLWYHRVVGGGKLPIVDTWWQTETGGILIAPLPGATTLKPGSATLPLPGVRPALVDDAGKTLEGNGVAGNLCLAFPWPGMMRTVYGDHERFRKTYFDRFPNLYFTGDGCRRDLDGYYWITGRVDDVLNVSGHRIGTAEVESALVEHPDVVEAAVVGMPHPIKGQAIYAFVLLKAGCAERPELRQELTKTVREKIGAHAAPEVVHVAPGLPKTRSGKIMRRILRKLAEGQVEDLGDVSTLADPSVVEQLVATRPRR